MHHRFTGRRARPARHSLRLETLEQRNLLAITPGPDPSPTPPEEMAHLPAQHDQFDYNGFLTAPSAQAPVTIAEQYLRSHAADLGITPSDVNNYLVTTNYVTQVTGATTLTFAQSLHGLAVANANYNITVMPNGQLLSVMGGFVPGLTARANQISTVPGMSAQNALAAASNALGLQLSESTVRNGAGGSFMLTAPSVSRDEIEAKLHYVATAGNNVSLAWNLTLRIPDGSHWYNVSVDSTTGQLVLINNYFDNASYEVFASPATNPNDSPRTIAIDPHEVSPTPLINPSPFGWHDTNGSSGAEFTTTQGNNVNAYADRNGDDISDVGSQPNGGADLDFTGPLVQIDLGQAPSTYTAGAVANLFYWNNLSHDVHYLYGFDEAARNFQVNNYGRGGAGNDSVNAEAQDGSGLNNANFGTPPDGNSPVMQMFEWDTTATGLDGDLDAEVIIHEYGHGVSNRLTGNANGLIALQSRGMGEGWSDFWALMLTQEAAAETTTGRGIATYVFGQPLTGLGIRDFRYDFDITNPNLETFNHYNTQSGPQVHTAGTRWAAVLWDINKLLIDRYGFEPNVSDTTSNAGNIQALKLVMNALKIQPLNPTFIQARDAILMADQMLFGGANFADLWTAFARRGLGVGASTANSDSITITTSIVTPPFPPLAGPDSVVTQKNTPIDINILANDEPGSTNAAIDPTTVTLLSQPANGTAVVNPATGVVTYTPNTDFVGFNTITYRVSDTAGNQSNIARVTIKVNAAPIAADDTVSTISNVPVLIDVLANDTDPPPAGALDPATVTIVSPATSGTTAVDPVTGIVTYTPNTDFFGGDSFTYTVTDIDGAISNVATVSIFVNARPIAVNDGPITTGASISITIAVLANDRDPDGFLVPSSVTIVTPTTNGTTVINPVTGEVTYSPNLNFNGFDSFQYTVTDNLGAVSNVATVTLIINAAPIAINDFANTAVNTPVSINVTNNATGTDIDLDGTIDVTTVQILKQPDNGSIVLNAATGVVTYTPNLNFEGGDTIQYRVRDNRGTLSNVATVVFRVGALHTLGGKVFVDLNTNGVMDGNDWPIEGVSIYLDKTDGQYQYTDVFVTNPDGTYQFTQLVKGTYTLREQHPGFFVDGDEIPGTPAPASVQNDRFVGINLAGGVPGVNFNFTEERVTSQFIAAFVNRQAYSSVGNGGTFDDINLGAGDAWVAINGGINGQLQASAFGSSGNATVTLYDQNLHQVARSTSGSLAYEAQSEQPYFVKLSGNGQNVVLSTFVIPPPSPAPAQVWHNSIEATDVDGDMTIELQDILIAIDAVNRYGIGSLTTRNVPSAAFLDVDGDGNLSPGDVLPVIDRVNRQFAQRTTQSLTASISTTSADSTASAIAFALAVDSVMEEAGSETIVKKRRGF